MATVGFNLYSDKSSSIEVVVSPLANSLAPAAATSTKEFRWICNDNAEIERIKTRRAAGITKANSAVTDPTSETNLLVANLLLNESNLKAFALLRLNEGCSAVIQRNQQPPK